MTLVNMNFKVTNETDKQAVKTASIPYTCN